MTKLARSTACNSKDLLIGAPQACEMRIEKRTLGWLPRPSLYQEAVASRAKQRAIQQNYLDSNANLATTIANINTTQATETGNIIARIAKQRILGKA
jgi:hypothetical protein